MHGKGRVVDERRSMEERNVLPPKRKEKKREETKNGHLDGERIMKCFFFFFLSTNCTHPRTNNDTTARVPSPRGEPPFNEVEHHEVEKKEKN